MARASGFIAWLAHVLPWYDESRRDRQREWTDSVIRASRARRSHGETTIRAAYAEADTQRKARHPK